jgi:hypothetical protein
MSMRNFTDILRMFAPISNGMATDIWSTLEQCEHPEPIKGGSRACATSFESMVEFAASVLGVSTYNLRAFSSPDAPVKGIMPGRGFKVVAATRVTEAEDTITCHGGRSAYYRSAKFSFCLNYEISILFIYDLRMCIIHKYMFEKNKNCLKLLNMYSLLIFRKNIQ